MFRGSPILFGQHVPQQIVGALQVAGFEGGACVLFQSCELRRTPGGGGEILLWPFQLFGDFGSFFRLPFARHRLLAQDAEERKHCPLSDTELALQIADRRLLLDGECLSGPVAALINGASCFGDVLMVVQAATSPPTATLRPFAVSATVNFASSLLPSKYMNAA